MRQEVKEDHEPILTRERKITDNDGTDYANIPNAAAEVIGLKTGDAIDVEIYRNCVVVVPKDGD